MESTVTNIEWFALFTGILGGLAIFLYGLFLMSDGLQQASGNKLRTLIRRFTKNRFAAFFTGVFTTGLVQSSSAVSVITISLVQAGLLSFSRSFGILLGAKVGTTITAQVIAFEITDYALLFIALGFFVKIMARKPVLKSAASAMMGFGLLFFGLSMMSGALAPLRAYQPFLDFIITLKNPLLGIFFGFLFTALIQSSSAFIGILIILSSRGLLPLEAAIPLMLGANLGTTVTAFIASLQGGIEVKQVALGFFMINLLGVLVVVFWIPTYTALIRDFTNLDNVPRQIANAHTVFNMMVTFALLPFTRSVSRFISWLLPMKTEKEKPPAEIRYLNEKMLGAPSLAISLAMKETGTIFKLVRGMLTDIMGCFLGANEKTPERLPEKEEKVDYLRVQVADFITRLNRSDVTGTQVGESFVILYTITELEEMADVIYTDMAGQARKFIENQYSFSADGKEELMAYYYSTLDQFDQVKTAFLEFDKELTKDIKKTAKQIVYIDKEFKKKHFQRLIDQVPESLQSSKYHLEVMGALLTLNTHLENINRVMRQNLKKE